MPAQHKDGTRVVAKKPHSRQCEALNSRGLPCGAFALTDGSGLCSWHAKTPEEQRAFTARAGEVRQEKRREEAGLRKSSGHRQAVPGPLLSRAIEVVAELLDAEIPDGSREPNYEARCMGVHALAQLFGLRPEQRAEILTVLERIRPALARDPQRERLLAYERARQALLRAVDEGRIDVSELPPFVHLKAV